MLLISGKRELKILTSRELRIFVKKVESKIIMV